jgi:uncharacterized membrane protein
MQFKAIECYPTLTYGVIDTIRRLCIVVVTGFFLLGEAFNTKKCLGVASVCVGAIYYNSVKDQASAPAEKAEKEKKED